MSLIPVMGCEPPQQQDWIANLTTNGGVLGFIVSRAFVSNNNRIDMMQPYNKDYFPMFPWTWKGILALPWSEASSLLL